MREKDRIKILPIGEIIDLRRRLIQEYGSQNITFKEGWYPKLFGGVRAYRINVRNPINIKHWDNLGVIIDKSQFDNKGDLKFSRRQMEIQDTNEKVREEINKIFGEKEKVKRKRKEVDGRRK